MTSSVPSCPFFGMSSSKMLVPYLILGVEVSLWFFEFSCDPSIPKLVYRDSESVPKFEGWLMFKGPYRMSKNIVASSVP